MGTEPKLFRVAQKAIKGKHYLEVSCYVELSPMQNYVRADDVVFFELSPDYDRSRKISMLLTTIDLRSLAYALKELVKHDKSPFVKYTDPKKASSEGDKKKISLSKESSTYYVNLSSGGQQIGIGLDAYAAASFADVLVVLAEETEREVYRRQRETAKDWNG